MIFGTPPQKRARDPKQGLVNIPNTSWWVTPDDPADPMDCARYPNSPWCGGNPIRGQALGLNPRLIIDECNFGLEINPTLAYLALPTFRILSRNPICTPPLNPPPNPGSGTIRPPVPEQQGSGIYLFLSSGYRSVRYLDTEGELYSITTNEWDFSLVNGEYVYPLGGRYPDYFRGTVHLNLNHTELYNVSAKSTPNVVPVSKTYNGNWLIQNKKIDFTSEHYGQTATYNYQIARLGGLYSNQLLVASICFSYEDAVAWAAGDLGNAPVRPVVNRSDGVQYNELSIVWTCQELGEPYIPRIDPPPPKPPRKKCCMCCPQDNQLLKLLLKRVGDFPANVPAKLNTGTNKNATVQIQSVGAMLAWLARNLDAMVGEFPLSIKIEDSDLVQEGNQSVIINPPNVAETLAEILGLLLAMKTEGGATLKTVLNTMIEAGAIRQTTAINNDYLDAISDFLGFKIDQRTKDLSLTFTPGKEKLDELLKETTIRYKTIENTDNRDINDSLSVLLEMAARWNAQNFRNLGTDDPQEQLKKLLTTGIAIGKAANDVINLDRVANAQEGQPIDLIPESTFDKFLEDAETQFQNTLGATDTLDPWGRSYEERPKITQIGKTDQGD